MEVALIWIVVGALENGPQNLSEKTGRKGNQTKNQDHKDHSMGGARGVMVIVVGNGHSDMSSNPGRGWLHFTKH